MDKDTLAWLFFFKIQRGGLFSFYIHGPQIVHTCLRGVWGQGGGTAPSLEVPNINIYFDSSLIYLAQDISLRYMDTQSDHEFTIFLLDKDSDHYLLLIKIIVSLTKPFFPVFRNDVCLLHVASAQRDPKRPIITRFKKMCPLLMSTKCLCLFRLVLCKVLQIPPKKLQMFVL